MPAAPVAFALCLTPANDACADVVINEIMADKRHILAKNGEACDWIELFNAGNDAADLNGSGQGDGIGRTAAADSRAFWRRFILYGGDGAVPGACGGEKCSTRPKMLPPPPSGKPRPGSALQTESNKESAQNIEYPGQKYRARAAGCALGRILL